MTHKRKSKRSSGKKEHPEKPHRRTRRHPKSEADDENTGSDESGKESGVVLSEDLGSGSRRHEAGSSNDAKGDESGGSDQAWHVRTENGNKGGIPKLKLCLSRPPELASPTSESLPSPKPRRTKRGTTDSPSKAEEAGSSSVDEGSSQIDKQESDENRHDEKIELDITSQDQPEAMADKTTDEAEKTDEAIEQQKDLLDVQPPQEEKAQEIERHTEEFVVEESKETVEEERKEEAAKLPVEEKLGKEPEDSPEVVEDKEAPIENEEALTRRSSSRDSSEERAKEAALNSRKRRKTEGSEDGEVVESPEREVSFPNRVGTRIRTTSSTGSTEQSKATAETQDQNVAPVRKRRWGSSNTRSTEKVPVLISTDVLKEIMPEAKPVTLNEVQLSPNREDKEEEGRSDRLGIRTEELSRPSTSLHRKRHDIPSDESEKDYEEEGLESGEEGAIKDSVPKEEHNGVVHERIENTIPAENIAVTRKISVLPPDPFSSMRKQKSPSPARHPQSSILYITNLVRPFTVVQLRDLLARTGTIVEEDGFWIDKIKSRCFVKYSSEEEAVNTRNALHGIRWPASNPKELSVDFGHQEEMKRALLEGRPPATDREKSIQEARSREESRGEKEERSRDRDRERGKDRERDQEKPDRKKLISDILERKLHMEESRERDHSERTVRKVTIPVREWDLGKTERGFSPPPLNRSYNGRELEEDRKKDRRRGRESLSPEPARKVKRKDDSGHTKVLLDDLFRKTKSTPCIYWLPLTAAQIAESEAMRRKHMAEHEKKLAEQRKKTQAKRRRPRSKSRSRSRSPKK